MPERTRLLFDVTRLVHGGLHTGIQRVVRSLLAACAGLDDALQVLPVTCEGGAWRMHPVLAPHPLQGGAPQPVPAAQAICPGAGDVLLLFDASWYIDPWQAVDAARARGARLVGMVHDLLPVRRPEWFRAGLPERFAAHLEALGTRAELLLTPSAVVAGQLRQHLGPAAPPVEVLAHGGDFLAAARTPPGAAVPALPLGCDGRFHLLVSTLEPRKQHAHVLDVFERLWAQGYDQALVFVGATGWCVDPLLARVRAHRERGRRLFHHEGLSDPQLMALYRSAQSLIYLSRDEGFGLPILEAAMAGCPVIAADLPVLREAGGDWPIYLPGDDPSALAAVLRALPARRAATPAAGRSWRMSATRLLDHLAAHGLVGTRARPRALA